MPIAVAHKTKRTDWFQAPTAYPSFTPTAGALLVVQVWAACGSGTPDMSISGGGLTWTRRVHAYGAFGISSDQAVAAIFTAEAPSATAITDLIISAASGPSFFVSWGHVCEVTGFDTGSPIGATGGDVSQSGSGGSPSVALSGTSAASSAVIGFCWAGYNSGGSIGLGSGWTSLDSESNIRSQYIVGAVSSVAFGTTTWDNCRVVAGIEVNADSGASPIDGDADFTEPNEALTGAATVAVAGVAAFTEPNETLTGVGAVAVVGAAEFTEPNEAVAASVAGTLYGVVDVTEPNETLEGAGEVDVVAFGVFTEPNETLEGAGAVAVVGAGAFTEPNEALTGAGLVVIIGTAAFTEPNETINSLVDTGVGFARPSSRRISMGIRIGI